MNNDETMPISIIDPRAENCRVYHVAEDGKVDGVELTVLPMPPGKYECKSVALINEADAAGNTTATIYVLDKTGAPVMAPRIYMAWPWDGYTTTFAERALPGNTNYPPNHIVTNGYDPTPADPTATGQGLLAIYVSDAAGNINSDVVCGLGLPGNRHVCYNILFQERSAVVVPLPPPPPPVYPSLIAALRGEAEAHDVLSINPKAALAARGALWSLWPTSNEFEVVFDNVTYVAQRFRQPWDDTVIVLYCVKGQWEQIMDVIYQN
jgi:hypothetical protein